MFFLKLLTFLLISNPVVTYSNNEFCKSLRYKNGVNFIRKRNNFKIQSTAEFELISNEREFLIDAYEEAEDLASINIARFLRFIYSEEKNHDQLNFEILFNGRKKSSPNEMIKNKFISNNYSTYSVLKGMKFLHRCYIPKELVRVTVEVSSASIKDAEILQDTLDKSTEKKIQK